MAIHNNRGLPIICIPIFARTRPTHFWNVVHVVALPLDCLQSSLKLALVCVSIPSWECSVLRSEKSSGVIPLANSAPSTKPPFASTYGGIFKTIQQTPRSLGLGTFSEINTDHAILKRKARNSGSRQFSATGVQPSPFETPWLLRCWQGILWPMVYGGKSCQLSLLKVGGAFYKSRQNPEAKDDEQDTQWY